MQICLQYGLLCKIISQFFIAMSQHKQESPKGFLQAANGGNKLLLIHKVMKNK
jgi:hypothetical protein